MQRIPDGMVDAVITDLPYGVLNEQSEGGSWDSIIPLEPMWEQFIRVTKPTSPIVLFGSGMFTAKLMMSNPKMWRYNLVWDKVRTTGFLNARKQPLRCHEDIVVFSKGTPIYNPQMVKCLPHQRNHSRGKQQGEQTNRCYGKLNKPEDIISDEKYPRSIIVQSKSIFSDGKLHPTQKPVDLLRYLILTYSNMGGGNFGCNDWFWHNGSSGTDGKAPLYRLRDQPRILRHRTSSHRRGTAKPDIILRIINKHL